MDKSSIVNNIEKLINRNIEYLSFEKDSSLNAVESFLENTVIRLINAFSLYTKGLAGKSDYLCAIRDFMLAYRTELKIEDKSLVDNNDFSIHYNPSTKKYFATYDIPDYIRHKQFVESSFINEKTEGKKKLSKFYLRMNSYLKELTGFNEFKSLEQKLCVYGALNTPSSYTSLISMPTGGGKSLVTQSISYEEVGLTIVIVPTISLAMDQERVAKENIITAKESEIFSYYTGSNNVTEISEAIKQRKARMLFISPEALIKNESFAEMIKLANSSRYLKNIVIDEAHIVVAWGDFFRVDYQCLGPWRKELLKENPDIRTYLLSATFTDNTVAVLKRLFSENDKWIEIRCDSLRKEPNYILIKNKTDNEKYNRVFELVNLLPKPMIIYVQSPYDAFVLQEQLKNKGYYNIKSFTGETKQKERFELIQGWTKNEFEIMIATSAFGVGVDKPDVRTVIHVYVPESPDAYYQELGRGGRDGLNCLSVMCITKDDVDNAYNHVTKVLTTEKLLGRWLSMFNNRDSVWSGGEIPLFTSTKPQYNKMNIFEQGNEADEKWNVNVLLLFNRYELIRICSIDQDSKGAYVFNVKVLNDKITHDSLEAHKLIDDIREKESKKALHSFSMIRNGIEKSDKLCWSSMFYDTYPLVSEYCSGCNQHVNVICDEADRFPLLVDVKGPGRQLSQMTKELFSTTDNAIIFSKNDDTDLVDKYQPNIVVCDDGLTFSEKANPCINYLNFLEYASLIKRDNEFYVSGLIMVFYDKDINKASSEYKMILKYKKSGIRFMHVIHSDFVVNTVSGKMFTDDVDGRVIE